MKKNVGFLYIAFGIFLIICVEVIWNLISDFEISVYKLDFPSMFNIIKWLLIVASIIYLNCKENVFNNKKEKVILNVTFLVIIVVHIIIVKIFSVNLTAIGIVVISEIIFSLKMKNKQLEERNINKDVFVDFFIPLIILSALFCLVDLIMSLLLENYSRLIGISSTFSGALLNNIFLFAYIIYLYNMLKNKYSNSNLNTLKIYCIFFCIIFLILCIPKLINNCAMAKDK